MTQELIKRLEEIAEDLLADEGIVCQNDSATVKEAIAALKELSTVKESLLATQQSLFECANARNDARTALATAEEALRACRNHCVPAGSDFGDSYIVKIVDAALATKEPCEICHGAGYHGGVNSRLPDAACSTCGGTGSVVREIWPGVGQDKACPDCTKESL